MSEKNIGIVKEVKGPVVDIEFPSGQLPAIYNAIRVANKLISDKKGNLVVEVAQHLGDNMVRCISMDTTEGLSRGIDCEDTGKPIQAPAGRNSRPSPRTSRNHGTSARGLPRLDIISQFWPLRASFISAMASSPASSNT